MQDTIIFLSHQGLDLFGLRISYLYCVWKPASKKIPQLLVQRGFYEHAPRSVQPKF